MLYKLCDRVFVYEFVEFCFVILKVDCVYTRGRQSLCFGKKKILYMIKVS